MKKCILIINPNSGRDLNKAYLFEYQKILLKYGYETIVYFTKCQHHATEIIETLPNEVDLVISMGGDGTFNEVVTGNMKREHKLLLSHIPVGTTNDVGAMFGYGKDPIKNLKSALDGVVKGIDICTINGKPFVYVAGFGKFMNISYETPRELKSKIGQLAYILEGAKDLVNPTPLYKITYTADGVTKKGEYSFMLISNANRIAGINNIYKDVFLNDNKFEVVLCNLTKKSEVIKSLYYLATSKMKQAKGFEFLKVSNLEIEFEKDFKNSWCLDGEEYNINTNKFKIEIVNDFNILIPKKNVKKIFEEKNENKLSTRTR